MLFRLVPTYKTNLNKMLCIHKPFTTFPPLAVAGLLLFSLIICISKEFKIPLRGFSFDEKEAKSQDLVNVTLKAFGFTKQL
jgi:hypothetical protein